MTIVTVPKPDDRAEWLKARHGWFNASDAGCLYGVHPFRNLADVTADKLRPEPEDNGQNDAMDRGNRLEPVILDWFGDQHGCQVVVPRVLYTNGRIMATIDGEPVGTTDVWVEVKTTSYRYDEPADYWYWQVVAQAAASGKTECWVVWIDADLRFKQAKVTPPAEHIADVQRRAEAFMDFIDLGMVPEGVEMSAEHLARMYPEPVAGHFADLDDDGLSAVVLWEQLRQERIAVEKAEKEAKDRVARLIADAEGARYDGRLVCTWKANKASERLDAKALEADHPDLVAEYRREVPGPRVLRATKELSV